MTTNELSDAIALRDAIIDRLTTFLGVGPCNCADGWFWIYASKGVLEPLTEAEVTYFEDWVFPLGRYPANDGDYCLSARMDGPDHRPILCQRTKGHDGQHLVSMGDWSHEW